MFLKAPAYFVTVTFNWKGEVSERSASSRLSDFSHRIDEQLLGGRFYRKPPQERLLFVFVPELKDAYYHYHGLMAAPPIVQRRAELAQFESLVETTWKNIVPSSTTDCQNLNDEGAMMYATKENNLNGDDAVWSLDFWSSLSQK